MPSSPASRIALWFLIVVTGLLALLHMVGTFAIADGEDERLMFSCFAGLDLLSLAILLVPVRRGEMWGWSVSWISVVATALVLPIAGLNDMTLGYSYLAIAVVMAACLLLARPRSVR